jgi:hypothetical protein
MPWQVVLSTLATGRVLRRVFPNEAAARLFADAYSPLMSRDSGFRCELYRCEDEMSDTKKRRKKPPPMQLGRGAGSRGQPTRTYRGRSVGHTGRKTETLDTGDGQRGLNERGKE